MLKIFRKKRCGQFFIISSVILASILFFITQNLFDYSKIDLRRTGTTIELNYIETIKDSLYNTVKNSKCERLEKNLIETETLIKKHLEEKGIEFSVKHEIISCSQVYFQFNITSFNFFSKTEFSYP